MPIFKRTFSQDLDLLEQHLTKDILSRRDLLENLDTLEAVIHKAWDRVRKQSNALSKSVNETQLQQHESLITESTTLEVNLNTDVKALDDGSVITESSRTKSDKHDTRTVQRTYITHADAPEFHEFFEINDLKAQLQAKTTLICNLKNQIKSVKDASNEAKVKNDIDVIETINIELEHSVAKLLAANEQLHKENEHLKQTYKELYDSIKKTRVQNKDNSDSLISQINQKSVKNANLKAQIQEKVFANAALKNELRKLKGNSVDTKFAKPSILGKPVLQPLRNQSVVRQPNAFKSERPNFPKPRFASQVDVNNVLSKPVTPHYLPKVREYVLAKPHHVIAPGSSRNSQKVSYGSNDMPHNHYLEEARKKAQERNRNSNNVTDNTPEFDSEPSNGSNDDITNSYECDQTLNVSEGTTNLSADKMTSVHISSGLALQRQNDICSHQFRPRSSTIDGDLEYGRYGLEYIVLPSSGYGVLDLVSFMVFGEYRHRYVVSSLMDTAY
ncbi:hypothetical protein Tco_0152798 [Tanacetum coccineum]